MQCAVNWRRSVSVLSMCFLFSAVGLVPLSAQQSAAAAQELDAQSATLKSIVERLAGMVGGGESTRYAAPPAAKRSPRS